MWSGGHPLLAGADYGGGFGTQNSAVLATGRSPGTPTAYFGSQEYNGSAWSTGGTTNCQTGEGYGRAGAGTQNAGLLFGGWPAQTWTEKYDGPELRTAVHPIFRPHSETGRPTVYVNELMTESIEGLTESESRDSLHEIFALQREKRFCYEHVWAKGDLVMWDNRCTLHARTDFSRNERRLLRRVTIEDTAPEEAI